MDTKKVFISYAWDDENFSQKILSFSNELRANGIDAIIDQYEENPDMGWPIWMENQIETSDYVLVVATKMYIDKFQQLQQGKGVSWEIGSIYQSLYSLQGHNNKFIPIVFNDNDKQYVVKALQPYTIYNVTTQLQKLINRIKGIANVVKPLISESLPIRQRKSVFVSSPIEIDLWDKAKWKGVSFLYVPNGGWVLALIYEGDKNSAIKIFEHWQEIKNLDDYLDIAFIEGDIEGLPNNGYTCLIAPNLKKSMERAILFDDGDKEPIILTITRFQRMYPTDNFAMYNQFKDISRENLGKPVPIMPMTLKNVNNSINIENVEPHFDKIIYTKNIRFIKAKDIKRNDIESCVIPKYHSNFPEIWINKK